MEEQMVKNHLIVLVHGMNGYASDWKNFKSILESNTPSSVLCLVSKVNEGFQTYDGIDVCGSRLVEEVMDWRALYTLTNDVRISFIGHSMGGLIIRYCIGELYQLGVFDDLTPAIYMTLATPHLGTRKQKSSIFNSVVTWVTETFINRTGKQFLLEDEDLESPLLEVISQPNEKYMIPLGMFEVRILYSNVKNDLMVPYHTAAIVDRCPHRGYNYNLSESFPHVINDSLAKDLEIDYNNCFSSDMKGECMRQILKGLHTLEWQRHDVVFSKTIVAHEQIIFKQSLLAGRSVVEHACMKIASYL
eukprot:TRINITY_DN3641_c0_g1_i1.p1 TRINITY_DN3641_c0_g1~~TRINITY_DN3641_c0_g1_i1.p1  ORF type:complete len:303 (-),score=43.57 TRINITY_DN3641_c0_g1_i1:473-1381(-)